jgi:hypothetical protein
MNIKGTEYEFILNIDTSSPCSNCAFLRRSDLGCNFPKDVKKECQQELGTTHGWNTLEYKRL